MSLYMGLMSGTSADGMDAVIVDFSTTHPCVVATRALDYSPSFTRSLRDAALAESLPLDDIMALDRTVAQLSVTAVGQLLEHAEIPANKIVAIGSHGHTLRHRCAPDGYSWQMGDPSWIAEHTGITCVADFRRRDIAAAGEGAPLMPAFHQAVFNQSGQPEMVLNLGGIGNLTVLRNERTIGFDTGPGNALMDEYCQQYLNQRRDNNGHLAQQGQVNISVLEKWLSHPYFSQPVPKSTGRERFNLANFMPAITQSKEDALATLTELTVRSVSLAVEQHGHARGDLLVCGGGVHNHYLMARLQQSLPRHRVTTTSHFGVDPDWVEAIGFAWLAQQTLSGLPGNMPTVTGAVGERILGGVFVA